MFADDVGYVVGVDTHGDEHALALVEARSQRLLRRLTFPATRRGYRRALRLVCRRAPGGRAWAVEGSGSYGAGLARFLAERGECVLEVERPRRSGARGRAKSDELDAERAARAVVAGTAGARPRRHAETQALRTLLVTREGAVSARTAALNELRALLVTAPAQLRERLQGLPEAALISACLRLRPAGGRDAERVAYSLALRSLARRVRQLRAEAATLEHELAARVQKLAPQPLARRGVGPVSAAALLCAWSHRGRLRSEAAFARLAGAAPLPASSGKTVRHRLDRGGDRRLNRALHTIALTLQRSDPKTQAHIARRIADGKSTREAVRCLKRYLARSLFPTLGGHRSARLTNIEASPRFTGCLIWTDPGGFFGATTDIRVAEQIKGGSHEEAPARAARRAGRCSGRAGRVLGDRQAQLDADHPRLDRHGDAASARSDADPERETAGRSSHPLERVAQVRCASDGEAGRLPCTRHLPEDGHVEVPGLGRLRGAVRPVPQLPGGDAAIANRE
jgi:transposase